MVIVSTSHLAMKFPLQTGNILTVHVDQKEARECYAESLRMEPLRNDNSPKRKSSRKDRSSREARLMSVEPTVALVDLDPRATEERLDDGRGPNTNPLKGHQNSTLRQPLES